MKTFGELEVGDKVYSLSYKDWGILTEHIVNEVKRNDHMTAIKVKGYYKYQIVGDANDDRADLKLIRHNGSKTGDVAPSIEGVKQYWINEINSRITNIKNKIENLSKALNTQYRDLDTIKNASLEEHN